MLTHPVIPVLAKYSGEKMPDNSKLLSPLLYQLTNELQQSVKGTRTEAGTKILAAKIKASAAEIENVTERYQWFQLMDKIMFGKRFLPIEKKGKSVLDPCATLITNALKLPPTAAQ